MNEQPSGIRAEDAVAVIVVTPEHVDRYLDAPALISATALREGRAIAAA